MKTILLGEILNSNTSLRKSLGPFIEVLYDVQKNIPFNLRHHFYNNLSTLKIELNLDKTKPLKNFGCLGVYDCYYNKVILDPTFIKKNLKKNEIDLKLFEDYIRLCLYHEFMHMASAKKEHEICYSGFSKYPVNLGDHYSRALTEGYTEYLAYSNYHIYNHFYYIDMKIANMFMCILGNDLLAYSYYNILGTTLLENELKKICPNEDTDKLFETINLRYSEKYNEENVYFIPIIQNILVNIFIEKINNDILNGITYEELMSCVNFFKKSLITTNGLKNNYTRYRNFPNLSKSLGQFDDFYENICNKINIQR